MNEKPAVPHPRYVAWLVEFTRTPDASNPGDTLRVFPSTVEALAWLNNAERNDDSVVQAFEPRPITLH